MSSATRNDQNQMSILSFFFFVHVVRWSAFELDALAPEKLFTVLAPVIIRFYVPSMGHAGSVEPSTVSSERD